MRTKNHKNEGQEKENTYGAIFDTPETAKYEEGADSHIL